VEANLACYTTLIKALGRAGNLSRANEVATPPSNEAPPPPPSNEVAAVLRPNSLTLPTPAPPRLDARASLLESTGSLARERLLALGEHARRLSSISSNGR
jgi:hypothetical protein